MSLSGNNPKSLDTVNEKKAETTPPRYREISWNVACVNSEYKQLTEQMFTEQAARVVQRSWRKKKGKKFTGKYEETLTGPLSMKFFREPIGYKCKEHSDKINLGLWTELDFGDSEFVRNIYKAVRFNLLNLNRMATAIMLYEASIEFHQDSQDIKTLRQFPCDDVGGQTKLWSPENISYITKENILELKQRIKKLPLADRQIFIVNFSKKREVAFLNYWLERLRKEMIDSPQVDYSSFRKIMAHFIRYRLSWDKNDRDIHDILYNLKLNKIQNVPSDPEKLLDFCLNAVEETRGIDTFKNARLILQICIKVYDIALYEWLDKNPVASNPDLSTLVHRDQDRESAYLLMLFLDVFVLEQGPGCCISPDFNSQVKNSPLICLVLPTTTLYQEFLQSVFGDHASMSYFTAGQITPRMIRKRDDVDQTRPVELTHRDLLSSRTLEDLYAYNFIIFWHDFIFHLMRNSFNEHKKLFRHIKNIFTRVKGFDMSKMTWKLSDLGANLDISYQLRQAVVKNDKSQLEAIRAKSFMQYMNFMVSNFWKADSHNAYIIIIDMIMNAKIWETLLGCDLESYISKAAFHTQIEHKSFQLIFDCARSLIYSLQGHSTEYYVLLIQIMSKIKSKDKIDEILYLLNFMDINKFFLKVLCWGRNGGLYFKSDLIDTEKALDGLEPDVLLPRLTTALYNHSTIINLPSIEKQKLSNNLGGLAKSVSIFSKSNSKTEEKISIQSDRTDSRESKYRRSVQTNANIMSNVSSQKKFLFSTTSNEAIQQQAYIEEKATKCTYHTWW